MFRLIKMTFFGEYRGPKETWEQVHESPATMTVPLVLLALCGPVLAVAGSLAGRPHIIDDDLV